MTDIWPMPDGGTSGREQGTRPRIESHPLFDGLRIVDPIESSQFALLTPSEVAPTACDTDAFYFPVDTAARICTSEIETPYLVDIWIRDTAGNLVAQSTNEEAVSVPPGRYNLEVSTAQMKLYLAIEGRVTAEPRDERIHIQFSDTGCVTVGVRSLHEQPAATITTSDDPTDLMDAISAFGSALKTTSCERSFPTLRGHPPLIERGDRLSIPDSLDLPETGVRIEIPPQHEYVYPAASLAYYLGASVERGPKPRLIADGHAFSLTADDDFESTVARVLKHVFLMDCVTRTEGYYTVDLHERALVEERVDLDFQALYEQSLAEQVRTYLSVPYDDIEAAVPRWKLTADVIPAPEHTETLPFLANDLAIVRCPGRADIRSRSVHDDATTVEDFFGESGVTAGVTTRSSRSYRSRNSSDGRPFEEHVFRPPESDSIEQTYVGEGIPLGASKMTVDAYKRRLGYEPFENSRTSVVVVCNEEEMSDENVVSDIYGTREWVDFDISIETDLTTDEMAAVLRRDEDFLHYIGHVDEEGIRCADGWLDTTKLDEVNINSFLLNACKSYQQGWGLIQAGSLGGIVTVEDLLNKTATKIGDTLARLLDSGFSLLAAVKTLERESLIANHYLVVGDGNTQICESRSGAPHICYIEDEDEKTVNLDIEYYPSRNYNLGSITRPLIDGINKQFIGSGPIGTRKHRRCEILDFLNLDSIPIQYEGKILWSDEMISKLKL